MILRTFQPRSRLTTLDADGVLVGSWDRVSGGPVRHGYAAMVAAMAAAGIDTGGLPPIWAWRGRLTLVDATMLLSDHELRSGYVTIEFDAPAELTVASDYGRWNDHLAALFESDCIEWEIGGPATEPVQICLPQLRAEWVRAVRPLPTTGWNELDPSQPV